jgi:hypothetical protein
MMTGTLVRIEGNLHWGCLRTQSGEWVAVCDPLKLTLQSDTFANLMEDISLTINDVFRDLLASNELDRFLQDRGWHAVNAIPRDPVNVRFDMPFFPAMMGSRDAQTNFPQ